MTSEFEQADRALRGQWQIGDVVVFENLVNKPTARVTGTAWGEVCLHFHKWGSVVWYSLEKLEQYGARPPS